MDLAARRVGGSETGMRASRPGAVFQIELEPLLEDALKFGALREDLFLESLPSCSYGWIRPLA